MNRETGLRPSAATAGRRLMLTARRRSAPQRGRRWLALAGAATIGALMLAATGATWLSVDAAAAQPATPVAGCILPTPRSGPATPAPDRPATEEELMLIEAAGRGDTAEVDRLLKEGAAVDGRGAGRQTALVAAAWGNQIETACRLIQAGADVNAQDETEQSAYLIATSEGYLDLLDLTLAAGGDVRSLDSFNGTGLIRAAERGHVDIVARLLETDIAVDHVNRLGLTALLEAIVFGDGGPRHTEVVRLLLDAGADPNLADATGTTPLAHATQLDFGEIAALLERAGGR